MKKLISVFLAIAMIFMLGACGVNVSTTNTTTTTNADGSTTTTTTSNNNGVVTTTETTSTTLGQLCSDGADHEVVLKIKNAGDADINEFYITEAGATTCSNNLQEGEILAAGTETEVTITANKDKLTFDFGILPTDEDGQVWFESIDMTDYDIDNYTIQFQIEDDGWHFTY